MFVRFEEGVDQDRGRQESWRFEATTRLSNQFPAKQTAGTSSGNQNPRAWAFTASSRIQQIPGTQLGWRKYLVSH